jgi:TolB-like protein
VRRASGISSESSSVGKSIAAVSFENLNSAQNGAFLAHETNDDPLTKLAKIPDMKVGRTTTTAAPFVETGQTVVPAIEQVSYGTQNRKSATLAQTSSACANSLAQIAVRLSQQAPGFC